jgi:hypothetical protein
MAASARYAVDRIDPTWWGHSAMGRHAHCEPGTQLLAETTWSDLCGAHARGPRRHSPVPTGHGRRVLSLEMVRAVPILIEDPIRHPADNRSRGAPSNASSLHCVMWKNLSSSKINCTGVDKKPITLLNLQIRKVSVHVDRSSRRYSEFGRGPWRNRFQRAITRLLHT